jgi:hypothetical protein
VTSAARAGSASLRSAPLRSALLESALRAAALGWPVFPCAAGGKRPALRANWQDLATTSAEQIREWWSSAPYNIGISCGPSSLVVIDLDAPKPDDTAEDGTLFPLSGADRLAMLARERKERYPGGTYVVDTPSGGSHLYFTAPGDRVKNSAGALGPLIDVRADGGYVVGAGSRIGGSAYRARQQRPPPAALPSWLGELVKDDYVPPAGPAQPVPESGLAQGRAYAMAALRAETAAVAGAQPGTRNDTLNRAAFSLGQLVAAGLLPPIPVITGLISAARRAGLSEQEARNTVRSGLAGGARKPRGR